MRKTPVKKRVKTPAVKKRRRAPITKLEDWNNPDNIAKIIEYAKEGLFMKEIALKMGISRSTLYEWKEKSSDISDALKKGKEKGFELANEKVENALLQRALGYDYEERTEEYEYIVGDKKTGAIIRALTKEKVTTKHVVADVGAQAFWLKNRSPENWKEKQEVQVTGEVNNPLAGLTTEELRSLVEKSSDS